MNYDPAEYFRLTTESNCCPSCGSDVGLCECSDDEEWWENAESEVAVLDREEQR